MACAKVIELIGSSGKSFDDALQEAVKRASKTVRNISGVKVISQSVKVEKGKISKYKVNVKVVFGVED